MDTKNEEILAYFGINLAGYNAYIASRMKSFKVQKSVRDEYLDDDGAFNEEGAFKAVAFIAITATLASQKILNKNGVFELMVPTDQLWIQNGIYNLITFISKNKNIYENITGTSISTPNFNATQETSRNVIDNDILGSYTKTAFKNSEIGKYKLVQDHNWRAYQQNSRGEYLIAGYIEVEDIIGGI